MSDQNAKASAKSGLRITLDEWAVFAALTAAVLIRFGLIHRIPW